MRLYHSRVFASVCLILMTLISGCAPLKATQATIAISITAEGQTIPLSLPPGSSVQTALEAVSISLNDLDHTEPPLYTLLTDGTQVRVIRVKEEFEVEQEPIPFEQLRQPTEYLPEGELQLDPIQKGEPGLREITYRILFENGEEISRKQVKSTIVKEPIPQVVLVGVLPLVEHFEIPGRLAYLFNGDAWIMEGKTNNRRPVITSGDLDGHIFNLSSDRSWLLFTRSPEDNDDINDLWVADLSSDPINEINLNVSNIIHFADWIPGSNSRVVFSTVEPRSTAPGWQANNDLYALSFSSSGWVSKWEDKPILEPNSGGIYGWWGMNFVWSPDGTRLAYARPDSIGVLDFDNGVMTATLGLLPFQTGGDWAWVPGVAWGVDGTLLYTVNHIAQEGSEAQEESPFFELIAQFSEGGSPFNLVPQSGMFAYPVVSPESNGAQDGMDYQIAYLQAIFPNQSDSSRYRLSVIDRDGSNLRTLFPPEGKPGLEPQQVVWSPAPIDDNSVYAIAVIYQGNLWLVNGRSGEAHQITGDGLLNQVSWK